MRCVVIFYDPNFRLNLLRGDVQIHLQPNVEHPDRLWRFERLGSVLACINRLGSAELIASRKGVYLVTFSSLFTLELQQKTKP